MTSALAQKLGVDTAKVQEALKTFRDAHQEQRPEAKAEQGADEAAREAERKSRETALAKSLATSLGVSEVKVTQALDSVAQNARTSRSQALTSKLTQAVSEGKLTQTEADAVKKAVETGVLNGPAF